MRAAARLGFHLLLAATAIGVSAPVRAVPEPFVEDLSTGAPGIVLQLIYAPEQGKLVMRASAAVRVLDLATGTLATYTATSRFTDMSRSPDGRYVFVADYGGENIGYNSPATPSRVLRLDLQLGTGESRTTSDIAHHIEATAANRFILKGIDQWVEFTYHEWTTLATISTLNPGGYYGSVYSGDFEYNPATSRLIHGNSGLSSQEIEAFVQQGNSFVQAESSGSYGSAQGYGGTTVLSTDGADFYYGRLQVDAGNVMTTRRVFPRSIVAATGTVAFADTTYYDADTGLPAGSLPFGTSVYGLNESGSDFWAYNPAGNSLHHFVPQSQLVTPGRKANLDILAVANSGPATLDVLANDTGFAEPVEVVLAELPAHGTATVLASPGAPGEVRIRYVADAGYIGPDSFTYTASDAGGSSSARVSLDVKAIKAQNDSAVVLRSGGGYIYVLRNDQGLGASATVRIVQQPREGYAYVSSSSTGSPANLYIQYSPNYGGSGEVNDSFAYEVTSNGSTDTAAVAIRVVDFIAQDDTAVIGSGRSVTVDVTTNDLGFNWPRTVGIYTSPQHGSATVMPNTGYYYYDPTYIQYTPAPGFLGVDTVEYFIDDGTRISTARIRINVIVDADDDKIDDGVDNCLGAANSSQRDTDADGHGNWCDGDFNGDRVVNFSDLATFRARFATSDPHADLDGNGVVNFADLARFKALFGKAPGPSAPGP